MEGIYLQKKKLSRVTCAVVYNEDGRGTSCFSYLSFGGKTTITTVNKNDLSSKLVFGGGATIRRVSNGEFDEGSMFLLRFQGRTKSSTDTNKLLFFFPIDSSWDFDLSPWNDKFGR